MACKWLNLGQNPPRIPEFHTLTKVHEITPADNQSYLGALAQQSTFPFLLTHPYNRLKETTVLYQRHHSLYKLQQKHPTSRRSNLGTFDICSLHTNIPQEEGINIICQYYEEHYS